VKSFGSFPIYGDPGDQRLTVTRKLGAEPVPTEVGREWKVELVIPGNGDLPHIELHPVLEGDETEVDNTTLRRRWESSQEGQR
jgi:hypothetical protein